MTLALACIGGVRGGAFTGTGSGSHTSVAAQISSDDYGAHLVQAKDLICTLLQSADSRVVDSGVTVFHQVSKAFSVDQLGTFARGSVGPTTTRSVLFVDRPRPVDRPRHVVICGDVVRNRWEKRC